MKVVCSYCARTTRKRIRSELIEPTIELLQPEFGDPETDDVHDIFERCEDITDPLFDLGSDR